MQTAKELLDRVRWDPAFGSGHFVVGYDDHRERAIVRVPLERFVPEAADSFSFVAVDPAGVSRTIPYHRVREVSRDGVVIWRRREEPASDGADTSPGRGTPPAQEGAPP